MIRQTIERWHEYMTGAAPADLNDLLHDDVVFHSPVVFTPIRGKEMVTMYLSAAAVTFAGDQASGFRYVRETFSDDSAVLEFETTMAGKYVNGVDIIRADVDGKIVEFRVMIRPLQAVNTVHELMRAQLERAAG